MTKKPDIDDPALNKRVAARRREVAEKNIEDQTLADLIMLNAADQRITLDLHGVPVVIRAPLTAELAELRDCIRDEKPEEFASLLADFCIDESLDEDFFKGGMISILDMETLVEGIMGIDKKTAERIKDFRKQNRRKRSVKSVSVVGKIPTSAK